MFRKRIRWPGVGSFVSGASFILGFALLARAAGNGETAAVEVKWIPSTSSLQSRQTVLRVSYRWKRVKDPSIMILLQPSKAKLEDPVPIRFRGAIQEVVATAIAACEELQVPYQGRVDIMNPKSFDILAWKNGLGKVGGCVAGYVERGGAKVAAEAAFFVLNRWATDDATLQIEPPGDYFRAAGTMQILFFDGDGIVWRTSVGWPGEESAE